MAFRRPTGREEQFSLKKICEPFVKKLFLFFLITIIVAGRGVEPHSSGYEPDETPFL